MTTSRVLRHALDYIAKYGWCQNSFVEKDRVCAQMALLEANVHVGDDRTYSRALDHFRKFTGALSLPAYNDLFTTTQEDIMMIFKNAATLAEQEGD